MPSGGVRSIIDHLARLEAALDLAQRELSDRTRERDLAYRVAARARERAQSFRAELRRAKVPALSRI